MAYEFTRSRRRSMGFLISPNGLVVRAPAWVSLRQVETVLQEKSDWIMRKLTELHERHERLEAQAIQWRAGALIAFQGSPLEVTLGADPALGSAAPRPEDAAAPVSLALALPKDASPEQIRDATKIWLQRQAGVLFAQRLDHFAPLLQVRWRKLTLSDAATRWGSAGIHGNIRLNWRLIHCALSLIDYVVVHELCHLRVMNHSPAFWEAVASVLPDYAALRRQLRAQTLPRWR